eukprot:jgi/Chlat1/5752/Chrsp38S05536
MAARWAGRRLVAEAAARQLRACRTQGVSGVVGGEVAAPLLAHSGVIRHSAGAATAAAAAAGVASAQHARTTKQVCFNPVWAAAFAAGLTVFSTSTSLSFATAAAVADAPPKESTLTPTNDKDKHSPTLSSFKPTIVFVLGGPGAGKGTQCAKIMIADMIKEGKIVPSWVTITYSVTNPQTGWTCDFVLFLDCPEDVMEKRLLNRGEGRTDDNAETIKKRFKVFIESSMPVLDHFASQNKVRRVSITTLKGPEDVFNDVKSHFEPYAKIDVLEANLKLLRAIDSQDWDTYSSLCDDHLTAFEPEGQGGGTHKHIKTIRGLGMHKYMQCASCYGPPGSQVSDLDLSELTKTFTINVFGTAACMRAQMAQMKKQGFGAIVNNSSIAGYKCVPMSAVYGTTKAAVNYLTNAGAMEGAKHGVRVNAVAPGFTSPSEMLDAFVALCAAAMPGFTLDALKSMVPTGRIVEAKEVAGAVAYLLDDVMAKNITGQVLSVDGGLGVNSAGA